MPTKQERIKEIEQQEEVLNNGLKPFNKIAKQLRWLEIIRLIVSYLIVLFIVIYLLQEKGSSFPSSSNWWGIFFISLYPGCFGIAMLFYLSELPIEFITYFLNGTSKKKKDSINSNLYKLNYEKRNLYVEITDEENRIRRQKEAEEIRILRLKREEEERIQRQKQDEEIRILKEESKSREWKFIPILNDAVDRIQAKKMSIEAANTLYAELKQEYGLIKYLWYHTNVYYDNRFYKIRAALSRYTSKNAGNISPSQSQTILSNNIPTTNKIEVKPAETKVEPISPNYIPVAKTEITTSKVEAPAVIDVPVEKPKQQNIVDASDIKAEPPVIPKKPFVEEADITDLFRNKKEATPRANTNNTEREPVKIDYVKLNETRANTGRLGELYAFEWEKKRLEKNGLMLFSERVVHVSITDDTLGYDILSFCDDGSPKYIEVKTTTDNWNSPFYLTENEITAMDNLNDYFIYRIYDFNIESKRGTIFPIDCDNDIEQYYKVQPVSYRISPK